MMAILIVIVCDDDREHNNEEKDEGDTDHDCMLAMSIISMMRVMVIPIMIG